MAAALLGAWRMSAQHRGNTYESELDFSGASGLIKSEFGQHKILNSGSPATKLLSSEKMARTT